MRTYENILYEYKRAKGISDQLQEKLDKALIRTNALYKELEQYKLNNGMYHPMSDLMQYARKYISDITLVQKNDDGSLQTEFMFADEYFKVDEDGHLDYSSNECGLMFYAESKKTYVHICHGKETTCNYVGFVSIKVDNSSIKGDY